jgi:CRP-like cAMP-binding protein
MNTLAQYFKNFGFNDATQEAIFAVFEKREYKKGDYFLKEEKINAEIGLIEKGMFQYFCTKDGDEVTTYVATEGNFVISPGSFLRKSPARENIRALTEAQVWTISYPDFIQLKNNHQEFKNFYMDILENQLICIEQSRFDMITLSAEERYQNLLEQEPHRLQEIPLQYLSSILGITPRHLSRIRKKIR